jgi:hypothetical protein
MATNVQIAETIRAQLGGSRFTAMTGIDATKMVAVEKGLRMKLPRNTSGANILVITLTAADEYHLDFRTVKVPRFNARTGEMSTGMDRSRLALDGIQVEMLREVFTRHTGLYTSL